MTPLNVGSLLWSKPSVTAPQYSALEQDLSCDCLVIGGGMGGALLSYMLSLQKVSTILLDKTKIATGSTAANTGLLQYTNDKSLTSCINTFGEEAGVRFYKLCEDAMKKLHDIQDDLIMETQFIPRNSLYYASTEQDVSMIQEEYNNLNHYGFNVEYWDKDRISSTFPFTKPAALYTHGDAEVNPFQMCHSLVATAANNGVQVYENSEVIRYEYQQDGVICHTRNHRIFAKHVIFALGYETQEMKADRNAILTTSYAIATNPVKDLSSWHERSLIWESARPYLYMRTTSDDRIVIGGLDEHLLNPEDREVRLISQSRKLLQEAEALFPEIGPLTIDYSWASVFGSTHDGLPMIGPHPQYPHCYFLEGYGGNGTVYSMIAAELIADILTGNPRTDDLELFSLTRTTKPSPPSEHVSA
ncbi:NAD(P)/FAD-dependent oxidoreductase [Paenibacillus antarcticus]|uniref:Amino acid oxidase n=1 Tax=Paenibacillus antarcticus TaxID=253703 RepID=A0A168QV47_9BACL|nr:FAD-dependent oxidoreductase [Paenibacillus antarcticus]OAB48251.1 amino acid oxidase [Paenibacillus antarcticus]